MQIQLLPASVALAVILLLGGCAGAVKTVVDPSLTIQDEARQEAVAAVLQHGDWLVARFVHGVDNAVATLTNMPFSHAAIYDAESDEVIEADGSGVHTTPLREFLANSHRVLLIRPMWAGPENSAEAVRRARGWLGAGYNYTGLAGLKWPGRYYCTQLAVEAYRPFIDKPANPIPRVIAPGQMLHWGCILFDSGPVE